MWHVRVALQVREAFLVRARVEPSSVQGAAQSQGGRVKILSLCSGYGGLDIAVERHFDATTRWVAENDKHASTVLDARFPGVPNLGDVTEVEWDDLGIRPDIITAGYPCQPFSHAGKRRGTDDHRHIWPHIAAAIGDLRPAWVVLENVAGHLTLGGPEVVGSLARLGYSVRWGVVRASDAGAPHRRRRLFIVASYPGRKTAQVGTGLRPGVEAEVGRRRPDHEDVETVWGQYAPAIIRWEHVTGRRAPAPLVPGPQGGTRLNPVFVEWMMGLPEGWVTGVGIPHREQLRMLGNGVVPVQAMLALQQLTEGAAT